MVLVFLYILYTLYIFVYGSVDFRYSIHLCNYDYNQDTEESYNTRNLHYFFLFVVNNFLPPHTLARTNLFLVPIILLF